MIDGLTINVFTPPSGYECSVCKLRTNNIRRSQGSGGEQISCSPSSACTSVATRRPSLPVFVASFLLCCVGCSTHLGISPADRLQASEDDEARQEKICDELSALGAICDVDYDRPFPHSRITFGKQWRGGDQGTTLLLQLNWIDELTLATRFVDDTLLKGIVYGPKLSVLHLDAAAVSSQGMAEVGKLTTLVGLRLREVAMADDDWNHVCRLNLLWLSIESSEEVFAGNTPTPGQLPALFSLRLAGTGISDATVIRAVRLSSVRAFYLDHAGITDAGVASLSESSHLAYLDLSSNRIEGLSLGRLNRLRQLRELVLDRTLCSNEALKELSSLGTLESVSLNETPVTDLGVAELARMPNLRAVSLVGTNTTEESLKLLAGIRTLLTVVDANGDVVVYQRRWIDSGTGKYLFRWAGSRKRRLSLWTAEGRQSLDAPIP